MGRARGFVLSAPSVAAVGSWVGGDVSLCCHWPSCTGIAPLPPWDALCRRALCLGFQPPIMVSLLSFTRAQGLPPQSGFYIPGAPLMSQGGQASRPESPT